VSEDFYIVENNQWRVLTPYEYTKMRDYYSAWVHANPDRHLAYEKFMHDYRFSGRDALDAEYYRHVDFDLSSLVEFYRIENDPLYQTKIIRPIVAPGDIPTLKTQVIEMLKDSLNIV
jgi:hypothetical protein